MKSKQKNPNKNKYISLQQAAQIYGCTQKHMALMARRKKLMAVKIKGSWKTTFEWLEEYTHHVDLSNGKNYKGNKIKSIIATSILAVMFFAFSLLTYASFRDGVINIPTNIKNAITKFTTSNLDDSYKLQAQAIIETNKTLKEAFGVEEKTNIKSNTRLTGMIQEIGALNQNINRFFNSILTSIDKAITKAGNFVIKTVYDSTMAIFKSPERLADYLRRVFLAIHRFASSFSLSNLIPVFSDSGISDQTLVSIRDLYHKLKDMREFVEGRAVYVNTTTQQIVYETTIVKPIQRETTLIKDQDLLNIQFANLKQEIFNQVAEDVTDFQSKIGSQIVTQNNYYYSEAAKVARWDNNFNEDVTFNELATFKKSVTMNDDLTVGGDLTVAGVTIFNGTVSMSEALTLDDLTVNNLLTFANATDSTLTINSGNIVGGNSLDFVHASVSDDLELAGTASVSGQLILTRDPSLAHVFAPSWPAGTSNVANATLYINTSSPVADSNVIGVANNGVVKFLVDAEGDIYGSNLILSGSTSAGETIIAGNLTVQDSAFFGDSPSDTFVINSTINDSMISNYGLNLGTTLHVGSITSNSYILSVDGTASISDNFYFANDMLWSSIANDTLYSSSSLQMVGNLDVDGVVSLSQSLTVPTITASSAEITSAGFDNLWATTITDNTLSINSGNITNGQNLSFVHASVSDDLTVTNQITTNEAILTSTSTDYLTVNSYVISDLVPDTNTHSVGTTNNRWRYGYFDELTVATISATGADIGGTVNAAFVINSDNSTDDTEYSYLTFERGSPVLNASLKWDYTNTRFDFNFPVNVQGTLFANNASISEDLWVDGTASISGAITGATWNGTDIDISDYTNLTTSNPLSLDGDNLTIDYASAGGGGYLTNTNWEDFNGKLSSLSIDTSAEIIAIVGDETGSNHLVFDTSPEFTTSFTTTGVFAINPGGALTIGDNGDTLYLNSSDWDISTTGDMTGIGAITMDGALAMGANTITSGLINSQTISATANFTGTMAVASTVTWSGGGSANANTAYSHSQAVTGAEHGAVSANTANMIVRRDGSGNFTAGTISAALSGNATSATTATNFNNGSAYSSGATVYATTFSGALSGNATTATTATYATNATRLYASDAPYTYGGTSPYYLSMTYDGSRWLLQTSPATPAAVRVAYADAAGNAATVTNGVTTNGGQTFTSGPYSSDWFRSNGNVGWYNSTYAVGVYATQAGRVDLYNGAGLYVPGAITSGLINGQTISSAASFTGSIDVASANSYFGSTNTRIFLRDSDESTGGAKSLHANSNVAGFLNGAGSWMTYWDSAGNQQNTGTITAPIYAGAVSGSSYGSIKVSGTTGGYGGIYLSDTSGTVVGMYDAAGNGGNWDPSTGWHFYWLRSQASLGIGGSQTYAGYKAVINGNTYGMGTGYFTGTVTAPTFSGALSGNAATATLASTVSINTDRTDAAWYQAMWTPSGSTSLYSTNNVTIRSSAYGGIGFNASNWYIEGNASYGLYSNTGFYAAGGLWDAGNRVYSAGNPQVNISGTAARATRANGNLYIDDNYGNSVVGVYTSTRYQGVYAMGDSYKLSADGTTPGTLYGIAWTHDNVGGQAIAGLSHQALFMANGITQTAIGTGIYTLGNVGIKIAPGSYSSVLAVNGTGWFAGTVYMYDLEATVKNFAIPDPIKENYTLLHSSLEGPEVAVFYRGTAELVDGKATITLPEYFDALTRNNTYTVTLTPKGDNWSRLNYSNFNEKTFEVHGSRMTGQFDWTVMAMRADQPVLRAEVPNDEYEMMKNNYENYVANNNDPNAGQFANNFIDTEINDYEILSTNIYALNGNLGVGTTNPNYSLTIDGMASISDVLYVGGMDIKKEIEDLKASMSLLTLNLQGTTGAIVETLNPILPSSELMASIFQGLKDAGVNIINGVINVVRVVADEVKTKVLRIAVETGKDNAIGRATFPIDQIEYQVKNSLVEANSEIFITFRTDLKNRSWHVSNVEPGIGFTIRLSEATIESLEFSYWIVLVEEKSQAPASPAGGPMTDDQSTPNVEPSTSNAEPFCGDGIVNAAETCDDGNSVGGDGCSPGCIIEVPAETPASESAPVVEESSTTEEIPAAGEVVAE